MLQDMMGGAGGPGGPGGMDMGSMMRSMMGGGGPGGGGGMPDMAQMQGECGAAVLGIKKCALSRLGRFVPGLKGPCWPDCVSGI